MSDVTLPTLDELDQTIVDRYRDLFVAIMQEYNPDLDLTKRGPIRDLMLHPRAVLSAAHEQRLQDMLASGSLLEISEDPALADDEAVDRVLSNFRVTRRPGAAASGPVVIVLSSQTPVLIPAGQSFTLDGLTFVTSVAFAARTSELNVLGPNDKLLTQGAGGWVFTIDVVAAEVGVAGNVPYATLATTTQPPPKFVKAYAGADFTGGQDEETNAQLLARLTSGLAQAGWSSRPGVEALLRSQETLADLKAVSVVGFGDPEMTRDQHSLWPGSLGGRCDVYLRSDDLRTTVIERQATLVSKVGAVGTWQVGLARDDAPGFYEVRSVLPAGTDPAVGTLSVTQDARGMDLSGDDVPDIVTVAEAVYSRYQTTVLQFVDTITNAAALPVDVTQLPYTLALKSMPDLALAQDYLGTPDARPPAGDVLVKGPVPCFVSVSFVVSVYQGSSPPTAADVKAAVAALVNGLGFPGRLTSSQISQAVHNLSPAVAGLTQMDMLGRIRRPDGTMINIQSPDLLTVPDQPAFGVTARTVSFFLETAGVAVTVVTLDTPAP